MPGKQGPGKSLAEQIAELEDPTPKGEEHSVYPGVPVSIRERS